MVDSAVVFNFKMGRVEFAKPVRIFCGEVTVTLRSSSVWIEERVVLLFELPSIRGHSYEIVG
jgi:hypothetical protein